MNPVNWIAESIKDFDKMPDVTSKRWRDFWSAGQSVAQVEEIKSAGDVIREMVEDYVRIYHELGQTI